MMMMIFYLCYNTPYKIGEWGENFQMDIVFVPKFSYVDTENEIET